MKQSLLIAAIGIATLGLFIMRPKKQVSTSTAGYEGNVAPKRTPMSLEEARAGLREGFQDVFGRLPNPEEEAILLAQSAFETQSWEKSYNHNWGGLRGKGDLGEVTLRDSAGNRSNYAAYSSFAEGAKGWLGLLKRRYYKALEHAANGEVREFVAALKDRGYFVEPVKPYQDGVERLFNKFLGLTA